MNLELPNITKEKFDEIYNSQTEFIRRVSFLKNKLKPSFATNKKECSKCGYCCWRQPCDLNVNDLVKISEYLNYKNIKEFFNEKLTIQYFTQFNKYTIIPIRYNQDCGGKIKPPDKWFELEYPCIFLNEENQCSINEVKPSCGVTYNCWIKENDTSKGCFYTKNELENILSKIGI